MDFERTLKSQESVVTDENKAREEQRKEADLDAQKDMANSAWWMNIATWVTTLATAIGMFLLWRTLSQTNETLALTAKSLKATREANAIQSRNFEVGSRGWLSIEDVQIEKAFDFGPATSLGNWYTFNMIVRVKNHGKIPCNPDIELQSNFCGKLNTKDMISKVCRDALEDIDYDGVGLIFPGQEIDCRLRISIDKDLFPTFSVVITYFASPNSDEPSQTACLFAMAEMDDGGPLNVDRLRDAQSISSLFVRAWSAPYAN